MSHCRLFRNLGRASGLFCGLMLVVVVPASAAKPAHANGQQQPMFVVTHQDIQQPVEQESPNFFYNNCGGDPSNPACDPSVWVTNSTGCNWDVDDYTDLQAGGDLVGNSSVNGSVCIVADNACCYGGDPHRLEVSVAAFTPSLRVELTSSAGFSAAATVTPEGHGYRYRVCAVDPDAPPFAAIPESNGGTGRADTWTISVTNPGSHTARNMNALLQTGFSGVFSSACWEGA